MIPPFNPTTGYLPKGAHPATWAQLETALGFSIVRQRLLGGLLDGCRAFRDAGARLMYVDGSFATSKLRPGDHDCCYPSDGIDTTKLDPILLDLETKEGRAAMRRKYLGEFWPAERFVQKLAYEGNTFGFFSIDKSYHYKGLVALDLSTLP
jgi:hypothetical protein